MDTSNPAPYEPGPGSSAGTELLSRIVSALGRDTRRYVPAAVVPAATSLTGIAVFTRLFDAREYGRYSLVIAAVAILNVVLGAWIQQSTLRYLPRFRAEGRLAEFVSRVVGLTAAVCAGAIVALLLVYAIARPALEPFAPLYLPALVLLVAEIAFLTLTTVYQAELKSGRFAMARVLSGTLRLAFALGFVLFVTRDVVGLIAGATLAQVLVVTMMAVSTRATHGLRAGFVHFDRGLLKTFAAYGIPLIGWVFCSQILDLSDRFVIGAFRGESEVGIYSANYGLVVMGFGLLSSPLLMAAHPLIITAYERDGRTAIPATIAAFSRFYLIAALPVVMLVSLFSTEIVQLFLGTEFREGRVIIPFVLAGAMAWGLSMYVHKGLEIMEKTRVMLGLVLVSATANLGLNLAFVPRYGYMAAAVSTFVSYLIYLLLVLVVDRSGLRWQIPWATLGRSAAAAGVAAAILAAAKRLLPTGTPVLLTLAAGGLFGLALYAALLLLFREMRRDEFASLVHSLRRSGE